MTLKSDTMYPTFEYKSLEAALTAELSNVMSTLSKGLDGDAITSTSAFKHEGAMHYITRWELRDRDSTVVGRIHVRRQDGGVPLFDAVHSPLDPLGVDGPMSPARQLELERRAAFNPRMFALVDLSSVPWEYKLAVFGDSPRVATAETFAIARDTVRRYHPRPLVYNPCPSDPPCIGLLVSTAPWWD